MFDILDLFRLIMFVPKIVVSDLGFHVMVDGIIGKNLLQYFIMYFVILLKIYQDLMMDVYVQRIFKILKCYQKQLIFSHWYEKSKFRSKFLVLHTHEPKSEMKSINSVISVKFENISAVWVLFLLRLFR